jgi:DNA-binding MarR family transcriptional regulator
MTESLRETLRQNQPFGSLEQEAWLDIVRTAAELTAEMDDVLRPAGITVAQYNVLRILRGAQGGLCRNDVRDRMLTRMPDMTRLLDRMEAAGLVARSRSQEDRRMMTTVITEAGRQVLDEVAEWVDAAHRRRLGHLAEEELQQLIALLDGVRACGGAASRDPG